MLIDKVLEPHAPFSINRIESIYASAPFWIWSNPSIIRILIEPIIQWHRRVAGTSSAVPYVIGDIGDTYPQAIGPITALTNPKSLESTADMMIVTAALVRATGDASVVAQNVSTIYPSRISLISHTG